MKTLNLFGPINRLGMGVHFTNWAARLGRVPGVRAFVHPKGGVDLDPKRTANENAILGFLNPERFDPHAPSISLWHLSDVADFAGSFRAIYTVFETTQLTPTELTNCQKVDAVIVPTHWAQDILREQGVQSYVIPEGVDPEVFSYGGTGLQGYAHLDPLDPDECRFLSVGKLEKRKGMEVMLDAALAAAPNTKRPIHILAQWHNPWAPWDHALKFLASRDFSARADQSIARVFDHKTLPVRVTLNAEGTLPRQELVDMMRSCHWGLFPYFAEGWCLPLQESMALGLPPICQNYSGPTEYLRAGTFIDLEGQDAVAKDKLFFGGERGTWRQVITESLVQAIVQATSYTEPQRIAMGERASKAALAYTWDESIRQTVDVLEKELHIL